MIFSFYSLFLLAKDDLSSLTLEQRDQGSCSCLTEYLYPDLLEVNEMTWMPFDEDRCPVLFSTDTVDLA